MSSFSIDELVAAVKQAVEHGEQLNYVEGVEFRLPQEVLDLEGMSGFRYRELINLLIHILSEEENSKVRFLEVGPWKGSTSISALYQNIHRIDDYFIIEDFSEFGGPKNELIENYQTLLGEDPQLIEADCFSFDPVEKEIENINVYFYDGGHSYEQQRQALTHYIDSMEDHFIYIVDDWSLSNAKVGTIHGLQDCGVKIEYAWHITTEINIDKWSNELLSESGWWNGYGVFVLSKL